jgi:integrase
MVGFGGGLRWGEITALERTDIDWKRERVHVQRTWPRRRLPYRKAHAMRITTRPGCLKRARIYDS